MLDHFFSCGRSLDRIRTVPFSRYVDELAARLRAQGYKRTIAQLYLRVAARFLTWLKAENIPLETASRTHVKRFLFETLTVVRDDCRVPAPTWRASHAGAMHMLRILREEVANTPPSAPPSPVEASIAAFRDHLKERCGYAERTVYERVTFMRECLTRFFGDGPVDMVRLSASQILAQVTEQARLHKLQRASHLATAFRSYFRFLQFQGVPVGHLISGIPHVAHNKHFAARVVMTDAQVRLLLAGFDCSKAKEQRDYAMALCMLDLGIRASDVSALTLDDIDWHRGVIRISNVKTSRPYSLPLPNRVGRAIAKYLGHGRPKSGLREVFLRHQTPVKKMESRSVQSAMRTAYVRAGLQHLGHGSHVLRRTAATRMLRHGVPLKEIADVLGHQSIDTTLRYARLDPLELAKVALPWPEGQR
jgi:site-specific recombinase XerD